MDLSVITPSFVKESNIDVFESLIWSDRYNKYGDFELYVKASKEVFDIFPDDYYLVCEESDHVMIIEDKQLNFNVESGNHIIITGRSLESILDRRIIWSQTVLTGNLQNGIEKLLNENVISPTITSRAIPNFIFESSTDPIITALTIDTQFMGESLYSAIEALCLNNNIGFKITINDNNKMVFKLYSGVDRSYAQLNNPYVTFSPKFENIISSGYTYSKRPFKNVTFVIGEEVTDIGLTRKSTIVGDVSGVERREIYTDASNISQTVDDVYMTDAEYIAQLSQKGSETLDQSTITQSFDGEVDSTRTFKYGEAFYMGDIVQLESEYGIEGTARVIELIHSQSTQGISVYPTFEIIN